METAKEILKKSTAHTLSINEGSPLQDAVISAMKEYAECRTTQLKADKAELLEALKYANRMLKNSKDAMYDENYIESLIQKHQ